jgi:hypothetical protein
MSLRGSAEPGQGLSGHGPRFRGTASRFERTRRAFAESTAIEWEVDLIVANYGNRIGQTSGARSTRDSFEARPGIHLER